GVDRMKIPAAVTHAQGERFVIEEVTLSPPRPNEVLVKVVATGVCHTDAVARDLGISPYPIVLGHEGSGVVEEVGEGVTSLAAGDHVVMSFAHCGRCENCLTGRPTVCSRFNELNFGGRMEDGSCRLRSEEHTSELQSRENLVCRLLLEKKKKVESYLVFSK